jgi:hypothetical protein
MPAHAIEKELGMPPTDPVAIESDATGWIPADAQRPVDSGGAYLTTRELAADFEQRRSARRCLRQYYCFIVLFHCSIRRQRG